MTRAKATIPVRPPRKPRFRRQHGRHTPRCGGRWLVPSLDSGDNLVGLTVLLTLPPACLWGVLVVPELPGPAFPAVAVGAVALLASTLLFLALAHVTEPGLLTTETVCEEESDKVRRVVVVGDQRSELAAFRAKFCRETENCVENFDHFCPWVGNAVGRRNYRYFLAFVASVAGLDALVLATSAVRLGARSAMDPQRHGAPGLFDDAVQESVVIGLCIYAFVVGLLVFPLLSFHVWLVCNNQTTNENVKEVYAGVDNPHDKGCVRNCVGVWCARVPLSRVIEPALSKAEDMEQPDVL